MLTVYQPGGPAVFLMAFTFLKLLCTALAITLVIALEVLAGALHHDWPILVILIPIFLTPIPILLLRCCGGGDAFSSTSKGQHWAEFVSGCAQLALCNVL